MGIQSIWNNYKVLIVMGTSIGLIHWSWYHLKSNPLLHKQRRDPEPEPPQTMRPQNWRKWVWLGGGAFVSIHVLTWVMSKMMKNSVKSETMRKPKPVED